MNFKSAFINNNYSLIFLIFLSTILFHYIPFERSALSPDDYSLLIKEFKGIANFYDGPTDRPLHYIFAELQNIIIGDNSFYGLILNIFSNFFFIYVLFLFLNLFISDKYTIFLILLINNLIFQKIEIFQTPIYAIPILAYSLYLICINLFIKFCISTRFIYFILSFIIYLVGIFFYEPGFFTPFALFAYVFIYQKNKLLTYLPHFTLFFFIALFYYLYRETGSFGLSHYDIPRNVDVNKFYSGVIDIFHNILGRSALRIFVYGIYLFFQINLFYLLLLLTLNIIFIFIFYKLFIQNKIFHFNNKFIIFNLIIFLTFIFPNILVGGLGGRHLMIPSIFLSIIIVYFFIKIKFSNYFFLFFIILTTITNQGNNWAQVVASRVNAEIYKTIINNQDNLISEADVIIFNRQSFSKKIDYGLIKTDFNLLHTYYGAQCIEDHGVMGMLEYKIGLNNKELYFVSYLEEINDNIFKINIFHTKGYRSYEQFEKIIDLKDKEVFILDYNSVFPNGHKKIILATTYSSIP